MHEPSQDVRDGRYNIGNHVPTFYESRYMRPVHEETRQWVSYTMRTRASSIGKVTGSPWLLLPIQEPRTLRGGTTISPRKHTTSCEPDSPRSCIHRSPRRRAGITRPATATAYSTTTISVGRTKRGRARPVLGTVNSCSDRLQSRVPVAWMSMSM